MGLQGAGSGACELSGAGGLFVFATGVAFDSAIKSLIESAASLRIDGRVCE